MTMTALVVFTFIIALGIYDAIVVFVKGKGSNIGQSVSRFLQRMGFDSPLFVFMFGAIMGHLFFYMSPECKCPVDKTGEVSP